MRQALELIGWKVTEAENGHVAVELAATRPDVIILDPMMPRWTGSSSSTSCAVGPIGGHPGGGHHREGPDGRGPQSPQWWRRANIQKSDRDEMLRQLSREIAKCVKRQVGA
jgi:CheY-like chemotaxis protein